jgi:hypothetical protein
LLTLARCAVPGGSVEITRRVVTRLGLSITLLGFPVTHVGSQIAVPAFDVALPCDCGGVLIFTRAIAVLIWARHVFTPLAVARERTARTMATMFCLIATAQRRRSHCLVNLPCSYPAPC